LKRIAEDRMKQSRESPVNHRSMLSLNISYKEGVVQKRE